MNESVIASIMDRLDRLERENPSLRDELVKLIGGGNETAGDVWRIAEAMRSERPTPLLCRALDREGISSARGLSEWMASHPSFENIGRTSGGILWRVSD